MSWSTVRADQFCTLITDGTHDSPKPQQSGWKLITSKHLKGHYIDFDSANWISEADYLKVISRSAVEQWDILFSMIGTIGNIYLEKNPHVEYACKNMGIFKFSGNKENALWMYYYLRSPQAKAYIQTHLRGSTQAYVPLGGLREMPVPVPPQTVRNEIIAILRPIDEKIECNNAINDNLQQQAFSVFDNLIANAENNDYTVSDYAFLNPKRTLAKNQVARSIDMSQLSTSGAFPSGWEMKPFNGGMRFTNGDTLLARITPCLENGKTAFIDFLDDGEVAFGSTEYIVLAPKNDTPPEMLYCLARYPAFVDYAVKNMNGSSGRQRVSAETVGQYRLPLFDKHSLVLFKEVVSPIFLKMRYNSLENMRLAELRDALLPKLMSGEIDVSAVQL